MGTVFDAKSIIFVDILKNIVEFLFTASLEIKVKFVKGGNFMSSETVKFNCNENVYDN